MSSLTERADFGRDACKAGTPDFGMNGDDLEGLLTDAGDTIANILHYCFRELQDAELPLEVRELTALRALDKGQLHFSAEIRDEDD